MLRSLLQDLEDDHTTTNPPPGDVSSLQRSPKPFTFIPQHAAKNESYTVWATSFNRQLIHSPTSLSFVPYYDANGRHIDVLPSVTSRSYDLNMNANGGAEVPRRRMPNYVQIADAYIFQQTIDERLRRIGVSQTREDSIRLAGVQWIDNVRKALKLPVRTFDTAVVYYHKFRLVHSDGEYSFVDAAAASLFAACKIEDTLKKSRDILCAAHNLKMARADHLSPDDPIFEHQSRTIIGLERLMLEASGFDFRNRHPQHLLLKIAKYYGLERHSAMVKLAYKISLDLYRTFAPLKQCTATMAFSCLELAGRLSGERVNDIEEGNDYGRWGITRGMIMETLLDVLELYTHYRNSTIVGPMYAIDAFLEARIPLNEELERRHLPRFTVWIDPIPNGRIGNSNSGGTTGEDTSRNPNSRGNMNGVGGRGGRGGGQGRGRGGGPQRGDGHHSKNVSPQDAVGSPGTTSSGIGSGSTAATSAPGGSGGTTAATRQRIGERGREGTVRFMLNPDREREERAIVAEYVVPAGEG